MRSDVDNDDDDDKSRLIAIIINWSKIAKIM